MIPTKDLPPPPDRAPVRRALLSVSDKTGLADFGRRLAAHGVELLSTGGTARALRDAGLDVTDVADVTGFPEILGGRVKSLHPAIHGGILARRTDAEDAAELRAHGIAEIDLVVVNLYPFREATAGGASDALAAENVDIGGPGMLRAAAKNFAFVAAVVRPADYAAVADELDAHDGTLALATRRRLAADAFRHTADYDDAIAAFFAGDAATGDAATGDAAAGDAIGASDAARSALHPYGHTAGVPLPSTAVPRAPAGGAPTVGAPDAADGRADGRADGDATLPDRLALDLPRATVLRYGENPHQDAALYADSDRYDAFHGKALSYNNLIDLTAALDLVAEFAGAPPTVAILKHTNPCGVGQAGTLAEAYTKAFATDRQSPFGGIVAVNRALDLATAARIDGVFTEIIIAPDFGEGVLDFLTQKKNRRLVRADVGAGAPVVLRTVAGGVLAQTADPALPPAAELRAACTVATERAPTDAEWADLDFAWRVCKHVKSNAIVYAAGGATLGIGAGQMSRIDASEVAVRKAAKSGLSLGGSVVASDAFFPFADGLVAAADAGARAAIQPGGSVRDDEVIAAADAGGIAMVFTGTRHFRH